MSHHGGHHEERHGRRSRSNSRERDCKEKEYDIVKVKSVGCFKLPCPPCNEQLMLTCNKRNGCLSNNHNFVLVRDKGCYRVTLPCDPCGHITVAVMNCETTIEFFEQGCERPVGKFCTEGNHTVSRFCGNWYFC